MKIDEIRFENLLAESAKLFVKEPIVRAEIRTNAYSVMVSKEQISYCVGIIDMVDSTKLVAKLGMSKMPMYYQTFLNLTAEVISRFGGRIIKNIGDCLLFYFPESIEFDSIKIRKCFECAIALSENHDTICDHLAKEKLPCVNYRISMDYGPVIPMRASNSITIDMIGPAVNMCSKINRCAEPNGIVIGGDLYQIGKYLEEYVLQESKGYSIGFKHEYPVYKLTRR